MNTIENNSKITIHYSLSLDDGTEIESNYDDQPLVCFIGDGSLTAGMEDALIGTTINDSVESTFSPEQGYGYPNEVNIHSVPLSDFADDMEIAVGEVIAFDIADANDEIPGTILEIKKDEVMVDFSHPLAGRVLTFKATVVAVENDQLNNAE